MSTEFDQDAWLEMKAMCEVECLGKIHHGSEESAADHALIRRISLRLRLLLRVRVDRQPYGRRPHRPALARCQQHDPSSHEELGGGVMSAAIEYQYDDGGRADAGSKGTTGDCVVRAITIASGLPYRQVCDDLNVLAKDERPRGNRKRSNARTGVQKPTIDATWRVSASSGCRPWASGRGCKVHLKADELPSGTLVVKVSKHLAAVIDGVLHDNHDSSQDGTRCVYGYWQKLS